MTKLAQHLQSSKALNLGLIFASGGAVMLAVGHVSMTWVATWGWVRFVPFSELGASLFGIGAVGIAYDLYTKRDEQENASRRMRAILKEEAPTMRDAVLQAFAFDTQDLKRVATPEVLDSLATNALGLRLGDPEFAREIYTEVRDQAIRAAERWHDVEVSFRLSTAVERSTKGAPLLFDVTVEWQYTTVLNHEVRRFACVADRDEFEELVNEVPSTSTWFMRPRPGMDASSRDSYELLAFSIDGRDCAIRRSARKTGQTYSVNVGAEVVSAGQPVRVRHVYRAVTSQAGHRLFLELPQPARNVSVRLDYSDTDISHLSVTDLLTSTHRAQIARLPARVAGKEVSVDVPGWLLPGAGLAFVWTLSGEEPSSSATSSDAA